MRKIAWLFGIYVATVVLSGLSTNAADTLAAPPTPIQVYGVWHAGSDYCVWGSVRNTTEFDQTNHWLIDRGDGVPAVNLVVLSFVHPLKLLSKITDAQTLQGVPVGMTQDVV